MKTRYRKPLHEWTHEDVTDFIVDHGKYCGDKIPVAGGDYTCPDPRNPSKNLFFDDTGELAERIRGFIEDAKREFVDHVKADVDAAAK